jgi:hypothetical protein
MRFFVFGHALLEKTLRPYKSMTGRAFTVAVDRGWWSLSFVHRIAALDRSAAHAAERPTLFAAREAVTPVPLAGIPGWCADSELPSYYDDPEVFRTMRHRRTAAIGSKMPG